MYKKFYFLFGSFTFFSLNKSKNIQEKILKTHFWVCIIKRKKN